MASDDDIEYPPCPYSKKNVERTNPPRRDLGPVILYMPPILVIAGLCGALAYLVTDPLGVLDKHSQPATAAQKAKKTDDGKTLAARLDEAEIRRQREQGTSVRLPTDYASTVSVMKMPTGYLFTYVTSNGNYRTQTIKVTDSGTVNWLEEKVKQ